MSTYASPYNFKIIIRSEKVFTIMFNYVKFISKMFYIKVDLKIQTINLWKEKTLILGIYGL